MLDEVPVLGLSRSSTEFKLEEDQNEAEKRRVRTELMKAKLSCHCPISSRICQPRPRSPITAHILANEDAASRIMIVCLGNAMNAGG